MRARLLAFPLVAVATVGTAEDLPLNPAVAQENIGETICVKGWTNKVRPPIAYANAVKMRLLKELELPPEIVVDFELDHRIPLCLGGAPSNPRNLELRLRDEASEKDAIEACLARAVCAGRLALDEATLCLQRGLTRVPNGEQ
jgi:hypothetical protein